MARSLLPVLALLFPILSAPGQNPAPDEKPITGVVMDGSFRPVKGVRVQVVRTWPRGAELPTGIVETDAGGRFALALPGSVKRFQVRAEAPGHAPSLPWGGRDEAFKVLLVEGIPATVKVVDEATGEIVPGATVRTFLENRSAGPDVAPHEKATTDEKGTARVTLSKSSVIITASAPGFAPSCAELDVTRPVEPIEIRLDRGATISGHVFDPTGQPVLGARIVATATPCYQAELRTDVAGAFSFEHVPRGENLAPR